MSDNKGAIGAIIVGAGTGNRMGLGYNKVLADLCGRPVIEWTVRNFIQSGLIDNLVLVINPNDQKEMKDIFSSFKDLIDLKIVYGGETRQDSVYNGIKALSDDVEIVLIHDAARPFITKDIIERSILHARKYGAGCAGIQAKDTIKIVDRNNTIVSTPERNSLWHAQTPQAFKKDIISDAYEKASKRGLTATDDAGIAEEAGYKVTMFEGSYKNIKLTSKEDLELGKYFLDKDI
ncbi:MAG: 2-C-methyl-D-erythritol 4-phosphate cytidylyltransferase [Acetivibrionales bacterium]|jgi:2-C-methyl-D-erythritol 4-phosphate cytidylyltransferase|nr:2-C-methyl-D-erythritol 4-phosphate cytidylyltransferase [Clostridiaceae bacterium]